MFGMTWPEIKFEFTVSVADASSTLSLTGSTLQRPQGGRGKSCLTDRGLEVEPPVAVGKGSGEEVQVPSNLQHTLF